MQKIEAIIRPINLDFEAPAPFVDADFQPMDTFVMKWRWNDLRYNILPPEALAVILPFTPQMARELWAWSSAFLDLSKAPSEWVLSDGAFASVQRLDTSADDVPVSHWLTQLGVQGNPWSIISWQPDWAILTKWHIFVRYWDDFCYPGAFDVIIWPASEQWALMYYHEEELVFGAKAAL